MDTLYRAKPYLPKESKKEVLDRFDNILSTGGLIQGKYVSEFEELIKERIWTKNAIATTSCGTGLETVLIASGIKGKKFLVPTQTFAASVNCIIRSGNTPIITDVNPVTQCLDFEIIAREVEKDKDIAGVVLVMMAGAIPPDILDIEAYCKDKGLFLLTDDAHSLGANYYDEYSDNIRFAGTFGDAGVFSFYPSKIITTGEGGMITTDNDELAEKCRVVRNHGTVRNDGKYKGLDYGYTCDMPATNYRMTEFCAALGITQMKYLDEWLEKRNDIADGYDLRLGQLDWISTPYRSRVVYQSWWQYICTTNFTSTKREEFCKNLLDEHNIPTANAYSPLCHQQKIYKDYLSSFGFEKAESMIENIFSLPMYVELTEDQIEYVCEGVKSEYDRQVGKIIQINGC
jgi:perosamine synthetase